MKPQTLLETLRKLGLTSLKLTPEDTQSLRVVRNKPARKPDDQYRKIEALYPGKRYLELFARRSWPGWDSWGNQVVNDVEIAS